MPPESRAPQRTTHLDNRLSFTDQAMFLALRATGQESVMQAVWIYQHPVDIDALRRFHQNFGYGLYGRLIERSPLPFGRHRWVSACGPSTRLNIGVGVRDSAEVGDWIDEHAQLPIDPERGPGWHMGVQFFTEDTTVVSLVLSHCLADGGGALRTIAEGVNGERRDLGYPPPHSRSRLRALAADAGQTLRGAPEVARVLASAAKVAVRRRHDIARSRPPRPSVVDGDRNVVLPSVTIFVDIPDWDARAEQLGGTTYSLLAGFAAKLGERMGRRAVDGGVSLLLPISDRSPGDNRANAVSLGNLRVDPTTATANLSGVRSAIKRAIKAMHETPDESLKLLPLIPFVPKRAVKHGANTMFGFADLPVSCSNLGDVDPTIARADGTAAEYVVLRGVDRHVTREVLEQRHGLLTVVSGRVVGRISLDVIGYQPGAANSKAWLRELAVQTLAGFDLNGTVF